MKNNFKKGFTLIETLTAIAIFLLLITLVSPTFLSFRNSTTVTTTIDTLTTDLKNQQIKSMTGDTDGSGTPDNYSIYFQPDSYTTFKGSVYSSQDPKNFKSIIDGQFQISTTFPSNTVIFEKGSGEITGFVSGQNSITITQIKTGDSKTITLNKYGTVSQSN